MTEIYKSSDNTNVNSSSIDTFIPGAGTAYLLKDGTVWFESYPNRDGGGFCAGDISSANVNTFTQYPATFGTNAIRIY